MNAQDIEQFVKEPQKEVQELNHEELESIAGGLRKTLPPWLKGRRGHRED